MKTHIVFLFVVAFAALLLLRCSDDKENITNPPEENNLITNGSFEINNSPSLQGWEKNPKDTSYVNFSTDVPPGGGSYSIRLKNEWTTPGSIQYYVIPMSGTHRYRLSVFARAQKHISTSSAGGYMSLFHISSGNQTLQKYLHFTDSTWTSGSLIDTITTVSTDTLVIKLEGNLDQFSYGDILFDLCKFEKLD